ncbi:hypothetical protein PFISCL1PPCAC_1902 [Pristionchus fissidentatus]|uniref:Uncharacterized protein n=1 Tax=Pristionchus fissidentatus TaxID=1538716 RepID=A0AAV5UYK0_9BILA|nr:hypothetical protein PFISCL1PPCAC_1902 [Pristionchus fissidentatus]
MMLDAWLIGLSSGIAVFAFVFSLLTCTLFCCRDTSNSNSQEDKNDNVPEAYTEEIKRLLSRYSSEPFLINQRITSVPRCDSVDSDRRIRSQFPSRNASPSLHRTASRLSRMKDHAVISEEGETVPLSPPTSNIPNGDMMASSYENCYAQDKAISTIVNCPAKVILPSPAPLHNSPRHLLPKLSVTSPSFINLVLLEGDDHIDSEGDERTPLVSQDTMADLPFIPNLRKSEERADTMVWEAKRRTWRGIVDAVDGCSSLVPPPLPLPLSSSRPISPVASVNVTATIGGCEVGVPTSFSLDRRHKLRSETVV